MNLFGCFWNFIEWKNQILVKLFNPKSFLLSYSKIFGTFSSGSQTEVSNINRHNLKNISAKESAKDPQNYQNKQ